ncbi:MBL fold metallo-hydrolase [Mucilaginibacter boryungensis]|uniref:Metallo-beta-lactamase domain-containing protein n=1 Tax=Mucilaginibacter boryungensis TaxID=768480 RepID=A0ABR9XJS8_9SPHI|nr:MBL fold metallo-hydrolase [Mucilaginibacter boryungensis]MBE9667637.1 hypothetical protein [Mucilaginibacter boryungensis]
MEKQVDQIILRTYRIGTGDCFTLKFLKKGTVSFTMMIDCGSCKGDGDYFKKFVALINDDLKSNIDLLVITHEHLDHIIGFSRARSEFDKIAIGQVWVGWTEDPTNELAATLKKKYGKNVESLKSAISKMNGFLADPDYKAKFGGEFGMAQTLDAKQRFADSLQESLELYQEPLAAADGSGATEMSRAMDFVMNVLRAKSGQAPFYCKPGIPVPELPGTEGIRFYVLGPPESELSLKTEEVKDDVYDRKTSVGDNPGFDMALAGVMNEDSLPFLDCFAMGETENKAAKEKFFGQKENSYRNIDCDWLNYAGSLAIRLEKYINNTSLVLAIEFTSSGKVLLFPGDAQSGNWESWHNPALKWTVQKNGQEITVTAKDLLKRTVFYKVGHHLSHNGTASRSGLDLMESPELMSVATLDYGHINTIWKNTMPSPGVLGTLISKTKGRVFRIDEALIQTTEAVAERAKFTNAENEAFESCYKVTPEYIEMTFNG